MTEEITLESMAGVGPVTTRKLNDAGIHNIMDLVVRRSCRDSRTHKYGY